MTLDHCGQTISFRIARRESGVVVAAAWLDAFARGVGACESTVHRAVYNLLSRVSAALRDGGRDELSPIEVARVIEALSREGVTTYTLPNGHAATLSK